MNYFKTTIIFLILTELLSVFAWQLPVLNLICFSIIVFFTLILSLKKLESGIFIAVSELIVGSYGYLFSLDYSQTLISVRMGIFATVMLAWVFHLFRLGGLKSWWFYLKKFKFFKYYLYLSIFLIWGLIWGLIRGNNFGNIFLDFNNWLFYLYLFPLIDINRQHESTLNSRPLFSSFWNSLVSVSSAALVWLIIKTFLFLYIFSHQFIWALPELYNWIRDTRVGEITLVSSNFSRIFIQSQIYALFVFFIIIPAIIFKKNLSLKSDIKKIIVAIASLSVVIISFSRSFWVGLILGLFILGVLSVLYYKNNWKKIITSTLKLSAITAVSILLIVIVINLPPAQPGDSLASLVSERGTKIEAAGNSRLNMLPPLFLAISRHPVIGSGFGTTVTYRSLDPRVLSTTAGASGEYTTYAFEWSYLDLILKIGIAGTLVYLYLIFKILQSLWSQINLNQTISLGNNSNKTNIVLNLGLILAVISLISVNIFTPYLNHPLGIGFILIISLYASKINDSHYDNQFNH